MTSDRAKVGRVPVTATDKLIECLSKDGCVIATGFTSADELAKVRDDVNPFMEGYTEIRVCLNNET